MTILGHGSGGLHNLHIATVLDNQDPDNRGRIQVRLAATQIEVWASVMTNGAGQDYGISFLPKVDEKVIVAFVSPEMAIVMGALWSGSDSHPEQAREVEDKYCIRTPAGSQILLDDSDEAQIDIKTSSGYHITVSEAEGGIITIENGSQKVELTSSAININASSEVSVEAGQVKVSAGMVDVSAGMSKFSGVVQCDTLISNTVVASTYTPGAGNIW
jgi:uncharacterized protein involved in type VI secretion and phage assembly